MPWETDLLHALIGLRRPWLDELMLLASALGAGGFIWIVVGAIAGVFPAHTKAAWRLMLALFLSWVIVDNVAKPLFARARPFDVMEVPMIAPRPDTSAMPSGHAALAVVGALAGTRMLPATGWALWPLAGLVAVSRVYLFVHWPTDVLAGLAIGFLVGWFVLGGRPIVSRF